jgi:four helix bundle protein
MQDFRNLAVWQMARRLTKTIYGFTTDFPVTEEFGLKAQMRKASVSICANIAEGCGRRGDREFRRFLDVAMGSACELECETILSFDLAFVTEAVQEQILDVLIQIKRMLSGLISSLVVQPKHPRRPKPVAIRR